MNWKTTGIVISREYLNKVKKKSFIWTTLLVPILVAGLTIGIMVAMMNSKEKTKTIAVVDESGIVLPYLTDTETIHYQPLSGIPLDSIKTNLASYGFDGVLSVGPLDSLEKTVPADLYSPKPFGMDLVDNINGRINRAVEDYRIASYNIEGLDQILKDVKANVRLRSFTVSDSGEEKISEAGVYSILSMILGIFLFMFITLFGGMVMSSVIEEKSSRVVEVLVSSVKATELMFGKIIGIALVALTQFLLWIVLSVAIISIAGAAIGFDKLAGSNPTEMVSTMGGVSAEDLDAMTAQLSEQSELGTVLGTLRNLPYGQLIGLFLVYFVFGYLLYASMFAAVGAAANSETDTQQFTTPITIPIILALIVAMGAISNPDSVIATWCSIIPFTSSIVMVARIPFEVPIWQLAVSMVLLIATIVGMMWLAAKIYKTGILMYGKKPSWKELWKWIKY